MKSRIKDFMTRNVIKLHVDDTIKKAAEIMIQYRIDGMPVVDLNDKLIGIFTKTHALRAIGMDARVTVGQLMEKNIITISENALPEEALNIPVGRLPVVNEKGELVGIITTTDIMGAFRRQLEYAVEELNAIIDSGHNAIIAIDSSHKIMVINKSAEKLIGVPVEEAIGKAVEDIIPDVNLTTVIYSGVAEPIQKIVIGKTVLLVYKNPIISRGKIIGAIGIFQDISELEQISYELKVVQEMNNELNAILDFSADGFVISSGQGVILRDNKSSRAMLGIKEASIVGKHVTWLIENGYTFESPTLKVLDKKGPVTVIQHLSSGREIVHTGTPIFDENGNISRVVVNLRDLSELNFLREQLREAQSLSSKYFNELDKFRKEQLRKEVIIQSAVMEKKLETAIKVAQVDSTVLLLGESGVGKEQIAGIVHGASNRAKNPFIKLNCASIPPNLIESELFGYEGGSYTGASKEGRPGLFEIADGGTLFLDEIGELPFDMQSKLLRVLQEKEIYRVGGRKPIKLDVRIIAATNRDLEQMIKAGKFRQDLFYRLNVISILIPPLRDRKEDIPPLIHHFLEKYNQKYNKQKKISPQLLERFIYHEWKGNIRELENTIERLVVLSPRDLIDLDFLIDGNQDNSNKEPMSLNLKDVLEETEKNLILRVYGECGSTRKAAKLLGIDQSTIVKKMKRYAQTDS
ncbi:sigma 54-interacting transcriptional regulator [Paradesulfitobacterium ferrireducens]|uniref:sigma 54-interacting transcriptional regulator n=1 Tax=Paradesulfitobacterium ferrireducens TaxID=2816476 RepID=UPI001A8CA4D1|nr:sigma 54-interacting transcriptional regulator [Paradesulfitobacterium ferrireducens]